MPLQEKANPPVDAGLNRSLGLPTGVLLVAGLMVGSGVFKKIAPMAASGIGGPYIMLAWAIAGSITLLGAFTYAGFSSATTKTGGVYEYLRLAFGELTGFLYGWAVFMMIGSGAVAALALLFFQSVAALIRIPEPFGPGSGAKLFAVLLIALLTWVNCRGIRKGADLNNIITAIKILGILLLAGAGLWYGHSHPLPAQKGTGRVVNGPELISGFFGAMLSALYAYDGWANLTFITGEIKKPRRNIPAAIIAGVGIVIALYLLINYTFLKVIPPATIAAMGDDEIAGTVLAETIAGRTGGILMSAIIMICVLGSLNGCIITFARVYFRMAEEHVFFKGADEIHARFRTPWKALVYAACWCSALVIAGNFEVISDMVIFSGYLFFGVAACGLMKMKTKGQIIVKVTCYPFAPVVIILFCIALLTNTMIRQPLVSLTALGLMAAGLPFYLYFRKTYEKKD